MAAEKNHNANTQGWQNTFDLTTIVMDTARQWLVIVLAAIISAALVGSFRLVTYSPQYSARTVFVVRTNDVSSNPIADNLNAAETMTTNFTTVINSDILQSRVCTQLGLTSLNADISVSTVPSSNLMTLSVTDSTPLMAYQVILAVMDCAQELGSQLTDNISIQVLQAPEIPTYSSNSLSLTSSMKKAAMIGAALAVALFAFLSYTNDTIKTENDVRMKVDAKLMGSIPHERKHKTLKALLARSPYSMNIDNPTLSFGYVESIHMAATRIRLEMDKQNCKILMVTSVTENEGKSTVAANLALSLVREGRKVALLDCDFYKPSQYKIMDMEPEKLAEFDFGKALREHHAVRLRPCGVSKQLLTAFSVAPCSKVLRQKDLLYLEQVIQTLREKMDYVIVDSSPFGLVAESENIASICDSCILVMEQNCVESRFINDTLDQLSDTSVNILGCIFNNVYPSLLGHGVNSQTPYGYGYGNYHRYSGKYGYGYGYGYGHGYGYGKKSQQIQMPNADAGNVSHEGKE